MALVYAHHLEMILLDHWEFSTQVDITTPTPPSSSRGVSINYHCIWTNREKLPLCVIQDSSPFGSCLWASPMPASCFRGPERSVSRASWGSVSCCTSTLSSFTLDRKSRIYDTRKGFFSISAVETWSWTLPNMCSINLLGDVVNAQGLLSGPRQGRSHRQDAGP